MIKARGTGSDGREVVVLGLSHANLDRLRADQPIQFDGRPYGFPGDVLLIAGPDELTIAKQLGLGTNPDLAVRLEKGAP